MSRPATDPEKRANIDVEVIFSLARKGVPKTFIAAKCGVDRRTLLDWLNGVTSGPCADFARRYREAEADYVIEAVEAARRDKRGEQWMLERSQPKHFRPEAALGALASESEREDASDAVADLIARAREEWERERKAGG